MGEHRSSSHSDRRHEREPSRRPSDREHSARSGRDDRSERDPRSERVPTRAPRPASRPGGPPPSRPRTDKRTQSDDELEAKDYTDFRRLKRMKLASQQRHLIWAASPSPSPEPEVPKQGGSKQGADALPGPPTQGLRKELTALEAQLADAEADLFMHWLAGKHELAAAEAERQKEAADADALVGPQLPGPRLPGGTWLPVEPEPVAAPVEEVRIPKRGEMGMTPADVKHFESVGYVMGGSRYKKVEPVRVRKENQVYTAEEKAALAMFNAEEARKKEQTLMDEMRKLVGQVTGQEET